MGVDFFPCGTCDEVICDVGPYERCSCGDRICEECYKEQKDKYGLSEDDEVLAYCDNCTPTIIRDEDILSYLLKSTGMTREQVIEKIEAERND
jgi:hypothetical protein